MTCRQAPHRGAALILALAALVILATASVGLAAITSRAKLARDMHRLALIADELLHASEAPILDWLANRSSSIVLPPEATSPEVLVVHDGWEHKGLAFELRITAWDQFGMVPLESARAGSPLRLTLPEHALSQIGQPHMATLSGLDSFSSPFDAETASPFPLPKESEPATFGGIAVESIMPARDEHEQVRLGAIIATHGGQINVNTAPLPLIEQAMRMAGRGGIEQIVSARSAGKQTTIGALPAPDRPDAGSPSLVAASRSWAFRIDARTGSVQRSWWVMYQPSANRAMQRGGAWEVVQRIVILD